MINLNMFHLDAGMTKKLILRALPLTQTKFDNILKKLFSISITIHNQIKTFHYS